MWGKSREVTVDGGSYEGYHDGDIETCLETLDPDYVCFAIRFSFYQSITSMII